MNHKINHANIKDWAKNYDGLLFDGILCDPPYHLVSGKTSEEIGHPSWNSKTKASRGAKKKGFMGKDWDGVDENGIGIAQDPEMWHSLYKLLKPGGHLLAFSGSRTYHRMACAIEDAGFEIRDMIEWVYGSGFPKSLNIGKAVDKLQGNEREVVGEKKQRANSDNSNVKMNASAGEVEIVTKGTSEWEGYGTALKPAHEPCVLARKPLEGTVANNVLKHGTGGLNIDGTRVGYGNESDSRIGTDAKAGGSQESQFGSFSNVKDKNIQMYKSEGRFPANLIHDGSDEVEAVFPQTKSQGHWSKTKTTGFGEFGKGSSEYLGVGEKDKAGGSASRFFYTAKASKGERNAGLEGLPLIHPGEVTGRKPGSAGAKNGGYAGMTETPRQNVHPTVKPLSLTKYLATLIKPPTGGRLLVPFSGSGSEMIGALQAGWEYVEGVELTEEYIPIAEARIKYWTSQAVQEKLL